MKLLPVPVPLNPPPWITKPGDTPVEDHVVVFSRVHIVHEIRHRGGSRGVEQDEIHVTERGADAHGGVCTGIRESSGQRRVATGPDSRRPWWNDRANIGYFSRRADADVEGLGHAAAGGVMDRVVQRIIPQGRIDTTQHAGGTVKLKPRRNARQRAGTHREPGDMGERMGKRTTGCAGCPSLAGHSVHGGARDVGFIDDPPVENRLHHKQIRSRRLNCRRDDLHGRDVGIYLAEIGISNIRRCFVENLVA